MNTNQRKELKESRAYEQVTRLKEIMAIAHKLKWIIPITDARYQTPETARCPDYPTMQLSEVEKCMLAMIDDQELERLRGWANE